MKGQKANGMCRANNCDMGPIVSIGISFVAASSAAGPSSDPSLAWPFLAAALMGSGSHVQEAGNEVALIG